MADSPTRKPYPYGRQCLDERDIDAVVSVLRSDRLTQGPEVPAFERALCGTVGGRFAAAVSSGTAALHLVGLGLGWRDGDVVITTPVTFAASANCVVYSGARPDLVDVDPSTHCIDPNRVEDRIQRLRRAGQTVKAVVAVDYAGHPCDWAGLSDIRQRHGIQVVDDACHALGARYRQEPIGCGRWADATVFSFHPVKAIAAGEGGAIVANDEELVERAKRLRHHGIMTGGGASQSDDPWYYEIHTLGFNYRLSDIHAALGRSQLGKLEQFLMRRRSIAGEYQARLARIDGVSLPTTAPDAEHAFHLYPIEVDFAALGTTRRALFEALERRAIRPQVHYIPLHWHPYYQRRFGFRIGDFPHAERFYRRQLSLPMYPALTDDDLDYICAELGGALAGGAR